MKVVTMVVCVGICVTISVGQESEQLDAQLTEEYDIVEDETEILDEEIIGNYLDDPVDVNEVALETLLTMPGMTSRIAEALVKRRSLAPIKSIAELEALDGMTPDVFPTLSRCFKVEKKQKSTLRIRQRVERNIQLKDGDSNGAFEGSPYAITTRVVGKVPAISSVTADVLSAIRLGGVFKKDAGETLSHGLHRWYAQLTFARTNGLILIGDYIVHAGEGLLFGFPSLQNRRIENVARKTRHVAEVQPYLATSEEWNLYGVAVSYQTSKWKCNAFFSQKQRNGTLTADLHYVNISKNGLFRTTSEIQKKSTLQEKIVGGMLLFHVFSQFSVGTVAYRSRYNHPLFLETFMGDTLQQAFGYSFFGNVETKSALISAELAIDRNKKKASFVRGLFKLQQDWYTTVAIRHYPTMFFSLHGNTPTASADHCSNETGATFCVEGQPFSHGGILLMYDQSSAKENSYATLEEKQLIISELRYRLTSPVSINVRARWKQEEGVTSTRDSLSQIVPSKEQRTAYQVRLACTYIPLPTVSFVSKINYSKVCYKQSQKLFQGWGFSQGLRMQLMTSVSCEWWFSTFDTDSYDSRIISFEANLPGSTLAVPLYGEGIRWFSIIRIALMKNLSIGVKYSQLAKDGIEGYSSGNDRIPGSVRSQGIVQVDWTL